MTTKERIEKRVQDLLWVAKNVQEKMDENKLSEKEINFVVMCLDSAVSELDPIEI